MGWIKPIYDICKMDSSTNPTLFLLVFSLKTFIEMSILFVLFIFL